MPKKLSTTQLFALELAKAGPLTRWPGGFWALADEPDANEGKPRTERVPVRFVGVETIRGLERRGLLERCHEARVEEWRDPRRITAAGRREAVG